MSATVIFIHGLWIHASAWAPWQELFAEHGYAVSAPGWPGDGETVAATRANPDALKETGITQIVEHYAAQIAAAGGDKPVIIGHSFGGLIAQQLLAGGHAAAAVAIDPAPIKGVKSLPLAQLRSALPVLANPANRRRTVSLTAKQFRYAFGNAISAAESDALHQQWTIPGPGRPLFEAAVANFSRHSPAAVDTNLVERGPLLLISGTEDHTVPIKVTREVLGLYGRVGSDTELHEFEGRGHSLTIDSGWRDVADVALAWLSAKGL